MRALETRVPDASLQLDPPLNPDGYWVLDCWEGGRQVVVEWREGGQFGISRLTIDTGYGEGPDELLADEGLAVDRAVQLLQTGPA